MQVINEDVTINVRCKAFSGEGVQEHSILIDTLGKVLVWDSLAGYYTSCHSLSPKMKARIRRRAVDIYFSNVTYY
jgi:hypothetical protein